MNDPAHQAVFQYYNNLIKKENTTYNFSKADLEKERKFEPP